MNVSVTLNLIRRGNASSHQFNGTLINVALTDNSDGWS